MRKLFLLGLTLILFSACQNKPERFTTASSNIDEVKALLADYKAGNWEGWQSHYADSALVYHNSWDKGTSPQELAKALKGTLANTSSYDFPEKDSNGENNIFYEQTIDDDGHTWVNFWGDWRGTLAATGQNIEIPVHLSMQMKDGKIYREYGFYDLSKYTVAMQAIEKANNMSVEDKVITAKVDAFVNEFLNKKNATVLNDILADNFVRYMNDTKDATGSKELVKNMNVFFAGFPDFKIKLLHRSPIFNNTQFVHWEMTGTNTGEFAGAPATGKKVKVTGLARWHFNKDGKADEEDVFYDRLNLMEQLGRSLK
ncbi:ester cyclase [Flavobacteriaceae bacterium LMO-SS05]|jgi:predicted ester cyclase